MRQLVKLDPEHSLSSRGLRNRIEHIDERLDDWTKDSPRPFTTIETVIYEDYHELARNQIVESALWFYDVAQRKATFLGQEFDLNDLRIDLEQVRDLVSSALTEMHRAPDAS